MRQTDLTIARTVRISGRLTAEMTAGMGGFTCEWIPARPGKLTAAELAAYRVARDGLLAELAERIGGRVACIEI